MFDVVCKSFCGCSLLFRRSGQGFPGDTSGFGFSCRRFCWGIARAGLVGLSGHTERFKAAGRVWICELCTAQEHASSHWE